MNIESQLCNLELAKKLKTLGVKQESYFYWISPVIEVSYIVTYDKIDKDKNYFSALTVAELGEILPDGCYTKKYLCTNTIEWMGRIEWMCPITNEEKFYICFAENEANSRAKMLIYIIENRLYEKQELQKQKEEEPYTNELCYGKIKDWSL